MSNSPDAAELTAQWTPLALGLARRTTLRWRTPWLDQCFESAAVLALWEVARKVEAGDLVIDSDAGFPGIVRNAVRWALCARYRQEWARNRVAFARQGGDGDDNPFTLLDQADLEAAGRWTPEMGHETEVAEEIERLFKKAKLPKRSRKVLYRVYGLRQTHAAIAADLGITREWVRQIAMAAITQVRDAARA